MMAPEGKSQVLDVNPLTTPDSRAQNVRTMTDDQFRREVSAALAADIAARKRAYADAEQQAMYERMTAALDALDAHPDRSAACAVIKVKSALWRGTTEEK